MQLSARSSPDALPVRPQVGHEHNKHAPYRAVVNKVIQIKF